MQEKHDHPEFMKTVEEIRIAEEQYDKNIASAKEKAELILRKAKEAVLDERTKMEEQQVNFKNQKIAAGAKEIDAIVEKTLAAAKASAEIVSKKRIEPAATTQLAKEFLNSL